MEQNIMILGSYYGGAIVGMAVFLMLPWLLAIKRKSKLIVLIAICCCISGYVGGFQLVLQGNGKLIAMFLHILIWLVSLTLVFIGKTKE